MDRTEAGEPRADACASSGALACVGVGQVPAGMQARAKRDYVRRAYALKVAAVQRACRWIEAGRSVADVCREPDMPGRSTFMAWLAAHPELRGMVEAARAAAAQVFTPRRSYHRWEPEVAAEVLARIEDGRGLREVCAEPDMPVHSTVLRWMKEQPDYEAAYRRAREAQADRLFDLAWRIACEAAEDEVATARLKIQTLKWRVGRLAPRVYGPQKAVAVAAGAAESGAEDAGGDGGAGRHIVSFHVRAFARTPDRQVVEVTGAVQGMSPQEASQLQEDVWSGRLGLEELAALNAAGEARMDAEADAQDVRRRQRLRGRRGG